LEATDKVRFAAISLAEAEPGECATALSRALDQVFAVPSDVRIALLAGVQGDWPSTQFVCEALAPHRAFGLFEGRDDASGRVAYRAFEPGRGLVGPAIYQLFAYSAEADADRVQQLLDECRPGESRTFNVAGIPIGLLVCGENNVLCNAQSDGNRVSVRHGLADSLLDHVPVILNGAHTRMGNWGKLERRFEFLSRGARLVFYVTNKDRGSWQSCVRVYFDGRRLADGGQVYDSPPAMTLAVHADDENTFCAITVDATAGAFSDARRRQ
jgi:hypothetical protein